MLVKLDGELWFRFNPERWEVITLDGEPEVEGLADLLAFYVMT